MNKIKLVKSSRMSQIIIKSQKGQVLDERGIYAIGNNKLKGLIKVNIVQKNQSFKLVYNITGFVTFKEYLKNMMNKADFTRLLQNITEVFQSLQDANFNQQCVLLDTNYIVVNPVTRCLYFIYVPIQGFKSERTLRMFLLEVVQNCSFAPNEDTSYIREFVGILNKNEIFSIIDLRSFADTLSANHIGVDRPNSGNSRCPRCSSPLVGNIKFCARCGANVSGREGEIPPPQQHNPQPEQKHSPPHRMQSQPIDLLGIPEKPSYAQRENLPKMQQEPPKSNISPSGLQYNFNNEYQSFNSSDMLNIYQGYNDEPSSMPEIDDPYFGGTVVLTDHSPKQAYLIRISTGEKVAINKSQFTVGRMLGHVDYCVTNNSAVGRQHINILMNNGRYYICDLNSTNGTFINGRQLPKNLETEVFSGAKITLANEDFDFVIE